ncbi:MAG: hypothetical protein AAB550_00330 [Patescibacteria group bacterium]
MSKEHKDIFKKVIDVLGLNRHRVMPVWKDGVLVEVRKIQQIQGGLWSKIGEKVDGLEKIPAEQRQV